MKQFRNNGAIGALLDEYEKAINELIFCIEDLTPNQLTKIVDKQTQDEDCKSVQTVLAHVVQSGYTYAVEIRKWLEEDVNYKDKVLLHSSEAYTDALKEMFTYNESLFNEHPNIKLTEYKLDKRMTVRWGQNYDVEQLLEHAIVHILRHRRQIEKFKLKL